MNERHRYLLEQALDDALTPDEQEAFDALLDAHPELADRLDEERALHDAVHRAAPASFDPQFANRTMRRLRQEASPAPSLWDEFAVALDLLVRRFGMVPVSAVLVLAVYNVYVSAQHVGAGSSVVERLFGIPPIAVETVLGL